MDPACMKTTLLLIVLRLFLSSKVFLKLCLVTLNHLHIRTYRYTYAMHHSPHTLHHHMCTHTTRNAKHPPTLRLIFLSISQQQCSVARSVPFDRFLTVFSSANNLSIDVWLPGLARLFEIPSCNLIFVVETLVYMQKRSSPVSQDLSWFYVEESCSSWLGNTSKSLNL